MSFEKRRVGTNRHIVYLSERGEVQELALQNYVQELTLQAGLESGCPAGFAGGCSYRVVQKQISYGTIAKQASQGYVPV